MLIKKIVGLGIGSIALGTTGALASYLNSSNIKQVNNSIELKQEPTTEINNQKPLNLVLDSDECIDSDWILGF